MGLQWKLTDLRGTPKSIVPEKKARPCPAGALTWYCIGHDDYDYGDADNEYKKEDTHIKVNTLLTVSVTPWTILLPWKIIIVLSKRSAERGGGFNLENCFKLEFN